MRIDWKHATRLLADTHREHGLALVKPTEFDGRVSVSAASEADLFSCDGPYIDVKGLRRHLYNLRFERKLRKPRLVLWSVFNEEEGKTYVGVGLQVSPKLLGRTNVRVLEVPNA